MAVVAAFELHDPIAPGGGTGHPDRAHRGFRPGAHQPQLLDRRNTGHDQLGQFILARSRGSIAGAMIDCFVNGFANPRIVQVALRPAVAPHRVEARRLAMLQHPPRIAHDEQRADRLPFAPLAADLDRQTKENKPEERDRNRRSRRGRSIDVNTRQQQRKLLTPETRCGVVIARDLFQRLRDLPDHHVTGRMAKTIVNRLQVIDIQHQ